MFLPQGGRLAAEAGGLGVGGPGGAGSGTGSQRPAAIGAACGRGSTAAAGHTEGRGAQKMRKARVAGRSHAGRALW